MKPKYNPSRISKRVLILSSVVILLSGCNQQSFEKTRFFVPETGDLLFQDLDCGDICDAIETVTTGFDGANFSHVGIVARDSSNRVIVIEAMSGGVQAVPLNNFLDRSFDAHGRPKVAAGRLKKPYRNLIPPALKQARELKGKPYDKLFVIGNDAYYCSELIYEIFLRANNNKPIFTLHPMTSKDPQTQVILPVWRDYFTKLGAAVPEGQPGINPGGISRSPFLTIVHLYGIPDGWQKRAQIAK